MAVFCLSGVGAMSDELEPGQPAGANVKVLKNGAVYDLDAKRIVANPPGGPTTAINQSNTVAMAQLRAEKYRQAAAAAVGRATGGLTPFAGWGIIVERQAALATDIDKGRSSTEAARFVGSAIGIIGQEARSERQEAGQSGVGPLPGDTLRALLADLRDVQELKSRLESQAE
jgi:hypothetical protein